MYRFVCFLRHKFEGGRFEAITDAVNKRFNKSFIQGLNLNRNPEAQRVIGLAFGVGNSNPTGVRF
jgi:hypothetical protein